MIEKFFKNQRNTGIMVAVVLVLVIAVLWDDKKNPRKDFYGLLKSQTPATES